MKSMKLNLWLACALAALSADVFAALRCEGESGAVLVVNRSTEEYQGMLRVSRFQEGPDVNRLWLEGLYRDAVSGEEYSAQAGELNLRLAPMAGLLLTRIQ